MSTVPIPSIVKEALDADSVLSQSEGEMTTLARLSTLAEEWIEAKIKRNVDRCINIDAEMVTVVGEFRIYERRRRREEKKARGRSS